MAGLELKNSISLFAQQLKSVDGLNIVPRLDSKGNLVVFIPTEICIEEKIKDFNLKKRVLLKKYPEVSKMKSKKRLEHIKVMADHSLKITKAIMDLETINSQPRLRSEPTEFFVTELTSISDAFTFLDQQLASPNYAEVSLVGLTNGKLLAVISDINTPDRAYMNTSMGSNGKRYLVDQNGSQIGDASILFIAHTQDDTHEASELDHEAQADMTDVHMFIYYSGTMYNFDGTPSDIPYFNN